MLLTFPNGEHPTVTLEQGEVRIGSHSGQGICLPERALAPHHASISADRRGLWLRLPSGTPGVHLNARPVRRVALLRVGDQVCFEQVQMLITQDDAGQIDRNIPASAPAALAEAQRVSASRVLLRGVSGLQFGRSFTLIEPKAIGRSASCDIRIDDPALADRHVKFELHGDRVILRAMSPIAAAMVNGISVRDAALAPGDQIAIDQHRFVLEAPGLPARGQGAIVRNSSSAHTQAIQAVKLSSELDAAQTPGNNADEPSDSGALWWLIAAAAVLSAALTALFVWHG